MRFNQFCYRLSGGGSLWLISIAYLFIGDIMSDVFHKKYILRTILLKSKFSLSSLDGLEIFPSPCLLRHCSLILDFDKLIWRI